jgi:hypothetical protein
MPPKKKTITKKIKEVITKPKIPPIEKLNNKVRYLPVDRKYYERLPPQTHIGYVYNSPNGKEIAIVSAYIQEHYISTSGAKGMAIKCGNRVYMNLYSDIVKLYIFNLDRDKIVEYIKNNTPNKSTEEIEVRVNRIEEFLKNAQQLKRSTSVTHSTVEEKSKPKPKVKRPSSVIIKKKSNLSEF